MSKLDSIPSRQQGKKTQLKVQSSLGVDDEKLLFPRNIEEERGGSTLILFFHSKKNCKKIALVMMFFLSASVRSSAFVTSSWF